MGLQFSFIPALVITDGGPPPYAATYLSFFVYRNTFEYLRYGYAAVVLLGITAVIIAIQWLIIRRFGRV